MTEQDYIIMPRDLGKSTVTHDMIEKFKLVSKNDPILKQPTQPFDFLAPPFEPIKFAQDLVKLMYEKGGVGLAANQIGVPYSIFSLRAFPENFVCFNPRIVKYSDELVTLEEGCLTYPGIVIKIERPKHVRVRFQTPNGETLTKQFTGITARIFQHEFDHLQGRRFFDRVSKLKLDMAIKKAKKQGHKYFTGDFI